MSPNHLFITGCYRSGTTLLEKLLHQHPEVSVASQPAPVLYFLAKERFLGEKGLVRRYPIDHMFGETDYTVDDFSGYLEDLRLSDEDLDELFARLANYRIGHWTPEILEHRPLMRPARFVDVQEQILAVAAHQFGRTEARVVGGKEILCEEFVPHLIAHGHRAIVIVRDPRDVIASLDYAIRDNLTGDHRPTLYSIRLWRKSVAFAIAIRSDPRFCLIQFEDLVREPALTLNQVTDFLEVEPYPFDEVRRVGIQSQTGDRWIGNSSFQDVDLISTSTVGRFRAMLPLPVTEYVEALVRPELEVLGYEPVTDQHLDLTLLAGFEEASATHERFEDDYAVHPQRVAQELRRMDLLEQPRPLSHDEIASTFIFDRAYEQLRATAPPGRPDPADGTS